ncbi:interleukin-17 receptor A-like isoform X1 [Cetorhinus maximus]
MCRPVPSGISMLGRMLPPACYFILLAIALVAPRLAGRSTYETLAVSNRTVESCTQDCSQPNLPCRVIKGDCLPDYQDTWPLSPPRNTNIHIVLLKGVGPVLEINFTYSADANLISINKTVIAISRAGWIQCVTYWYINGFPAQTNHRGELWSLTYYTCHRLKPAQLLSVNIYSIPPTEALVKNVRLPDCKNPMMKRYAEDYCPEIAIQCVLNDTDFTVTYTSSHPSHEYLVYLCIWKSRYCSTEEAQHLAPSKDTMGKANSIIFKNIPVIPCLCVRVATKSHSLYHEEMECPFKAGSHRLNIKLEPTPLSLQVQPSGFPTICTIRIKAMFYYKEDGTGWLTNMSEVQELLVSELKMHEFSIKPSLQHKVLCVKVWSDDIYPLPEKIYCTQPKGTLSCWFVATSLIILVICLLTALILSKKYRKKSRLCRKLRKENEQLKMLMAPVKLLLLCSWDHRYFQEVIEAFAYYLQRDCKCEVTLELWERRQIAEKGMMIWLSEKLTAADKVTIIWSKGAEVKWKTKSLHEEDKPYFVEFEFGDLFTPALVSVADQHPKSLTDKFSVVYFERVSAGVKVPEIFSKKHTYKLMDDLQKFQRRLTYLTGTDCTESKAWQKLRDRIEAFAAYQQLSPSWFEDWHCREGDDHISCSSPALPEKKFSMLDKRVTEESNPAGLNLHLHLKTTTPDGQSQRSKRLSENYVTVKPLLLANNAHVSSLVCDACHNVPQQSLMLSSGYYSQPTLTPEGSKSQ